MSPVAGLAWAGAAYLALQLIASALGAMRGGALDLVTLGAAEALAYVATSFALLYRYDRRASARSSFGLRPTHAGLAWVGAGLGLSLKLPAESMTQLVERFFPASDEQLIRRALLYRTNSVGEVIALVVVVCLVAPLVEETFFRGALYGRLASTSPPRAAALTSLAFVVVHGDPRHWPGLAVVACVLGFLRVASGSLLPCLCLHVAFNAAGVLALVTGVASVTRPFTPPLPWVMASWVLAAVFGAVLLRLADDPGAARARAEDRG